MHWLYLGVAILFETIGTTALKASDGFTRLGPSILVVLSYVLSFWLLALVLRIIPVGVAYAIWAGLGVCLIAGIGWVVFGQRLDAPALLGLFLIISGIVVINLFSKTVGH
ncbi:small multidrug resistance pump [Roseinatronobacter thiooxidans]|uniref:Small multidrug resistance pump n=1 Tax=Roseinatronobacter thiooxidans TaxID=121821 RepID=A0A2W7Q5C2_9RHOB|nr:SMR family transporter [Roseinatronobacter thiooxidans]PZX39367.1 small multidrug resistance pump [Roseinatronobacter thiooxidans]